MSWLSNFFLQCRSSPTTEFLTVGAIKLQRQTFIQWNIIGNIALIPAFDYIWIIRVNQSLSSHSNHELTCNFDNANNAILILTALWLEGLKFAGINLRRKIGLDGQSSFQLSRNNKQTLSTGNMSNTILRYLYFAVYETNKHSNKHIKILCVGNYAINND